MPPPKPKDGEVVERFDVARMGRVRKTPQGFLQVEARLTRTGVLQYRRQDGSIRRELRLPEEVFADASLATLKGAPLTNRHDAGMIGPTNVREAQIGRVGEDIRQDGDFVAGTITVQDQEAIDSVLRGDSREISAGYHARLQFTEGTYQGERYDCIQRSIVYNHAGIGPDGWGRAGSEVAMKLDGGAAHLDSAIDVERKDAGELGLFIQQQMELLNLSELELAKEIGLEEFRLIDVMQGFDNPTDDELQRIARRLNTTAERLRSLIPDAERRDEDDEEKLPMSKVTLHLDGANFEVECPEALADDLQRRFKARDEKLTAETARADAAESERDELKEKFDAADAELKEVKSPEHIQERIRARVALEERAQRVLGADEKLDGKSDLEVMQMAIEKAEPDFKLDGKDEDALKGLFEFLTDKAKEQKPKPRTDGGRGPARRAADDDKEERNDSDDSRQKFLDRNRDAWQEPLSATKDQPRSN